MMNVSIRLPQHWSAHHADFLFDVVNKLNDAIWDHYGVMLCDLWDQPSPPPEPPDELDDDIPW